MNVLKNVERSFDTHLSRGVRITSSWATATGHEYCLLWSVTLGDTIPIELYVEDLRPTELKIIKPLFHALNHWYPLLQHKAPH